MSTEVIVALITAGLAAISAMVIQLIQSHEKVSADIKATRHQVQNSHSTNLRDDIDAIAELGRMTLRSVEALRDELAQERKERIAGDARFDQHVANHAA
jgi:hypothetical protein